MLYGFIYTALWKRQICKDRKHINGCQGLDKNKAEERGQTTKRYKRIWGAWVMAMIHISIPHLNCCGAYMTVCV